MTTETQAPDPAQAPRPFTAVKAFADSVLAMLDERIKTADQGTHPFNDYFGDKPEAIVTAKAQVSELREVRTQVRMLGDRALVDLMKFKPAIPAPEGAQALTDEQIDALHDSMFPRAALESDRVKVRAFVRAALAAPAPQAPVALTDEQIDAATQKWAGLAEVPHVRLVMCREYARAIEAAHGIPAPKETTNDR